MSNDTISVPVPAMIYQRLERMSALTGHPVECLVAQALASRLPPLPEDLSPTECEALLDLESLSDRGLEQVAMEAMPTQQAEYYLELRQRHHNGTLTDIEQVTLDRLAQEADLRTLRKAYAAVLLTWRGQRLPTLAELEAR